MKVKTLLVGGGGLLGSALCEKLTKQTNREVLVLGRSEVPRYALPENVKYYSSAGGGGVCFDTLLEGVAHVVDLAYATVPTTSYSDPVNDILSNLPFSVDLLRKLAERPISKLLVVSSGGTVYGEPRYLPIEETFETNPVSPYGITKLAVEKYALMFHALQGLPVVIARPSNPYGPTQRGNLLQGFVGAAIGAILSGKPVTIYGERGTVRDYLYMDDLVDGLIAALEHGKNGEVYNIGTSTGHDNLEVIDLLEPIVKADGFELLRQHQPSRPFDVRLNVLASSKLELVSGWRSQISMPEGLRRTWRAAIDV
jgi:UDP-glucose 4-epimerase